MKSRIPLLLLLGMVGCKQAVPPIITSSGSWIFVVNEGDGKPHGLKIDGARVRCVDLDNGVFAYILIADSKGKLVSRFSCLPNGDVRMIDMGRVDDAPGGSK
jgi:hypothetical protein